MLEGNTKPPTRSRTWVLTLNNYNRDEYEHLKDWVGTRGVFVFGKETGENGTPHIQGYMKFRSAMRFETLKKEFPRAHVEIARGSVANNYRYCTKDGQFETNLPQPPDDDEPNTYPDPFETYGITPYPWQNTVVGLVRTEPDPRKIHWFWEEYGNVGKSIMAEHLLNTYPGTMICSGKTADAANILFPQYEELKKKRIPHFMVIFDLFREQTSGECAYGLMEMIKNRLVIGTKYKGGIMRFKKPVHVIVFANFKPLQRGLSTDRADVYRIIQRDRFKEDDLEPTITYIADRDD